MTTQKPIAAIILLLSCGCTIPSPVELPAGTMKVSSDRNWKQWRRSGPIQTITFGNYQITAPDHGRTNDKGGFDISLIGFDLEKSREENALTFDLQYNGELAARVVAESFRKDKAITAKWVNIQLENHDWIRGTIATPVSQPFEFMLNGFHSESLSDQATGQITGNGRTIVIREVQSSWSRNYKGLPAVEFLLDGKRIGLITKLNQRSVWIDESQPDDVRTAVAGAAAALLIAPRLSSDF